MGGRAQKGAIGSHGWWVRRGKEQSDPRAGKDLLPSVTTQVASALTVPSLLPMLLGAPEPPRQLQRPRRREAIPQPERGRSRPR